MVYFQTVIYFEISQYYYIIVFSLRNLYEKAINLIPLINWHKYNLFYNSKMIWIFNQMNCTIGLNKKCVSHYNKIESNCMFAEHTIPFIQTPFFAIQSRFDLYQISFLFVNKNDTVQINQYGNYFRDVFNNTIMNNNKKFSLHARGESFGFAWQGIRSFFSSEHNAYIHLFCTVMMVGGTIFLKVSRMEMIALVIVTGIVWMAELFNTAIEKIMDFVHPEIHPGVKKIKDFAAAAVLIAAIMALIIGCIVFIPKIPI